MAWIEGPREKDERYVVRWRAHDGGQLLKRSRVVATLEEANELKADAERKEVRVTVPQPRSRRGRVSRKTFRKASSSSPAR